MIQPRRRRPKSLPAVRLGAGLLVGLRGRFSFWIGPASPSVWLAGCRPSQRRTRWGWRALGSGFREAVAILRTSPAGGVGDGLGDVLFNRGGRGVTDIQ